MLIFTFLSHTTHTFIITILSAACARSGEYSHALQLFVNMQADGIQGDIVAYNALVSAFANSGQSELVSHVC